MSGFSIWHWLIVLISLSWAIPCGIIAKRVGYSPIAGALMALPLVAFITVWVFAFVRWPIDERCAQVTDRFD